jgi:hypothetical protein
LAKRVLLALVLFLTASISASAQGRADLPPFEEAPRDVVRGVPAALPLAEDPTCDDGVEGAGDGAQARGAQKGAPEIVPAVVAPEAATSPLSPPAAPVPAPVPDEPKGFDWGGATKQSLLFLGIQHGYRMTEEKTTRELRGPFFRDYFQSVGGLGGWEDGGRFFTNYVAHPMQGAITGFIQIQNDPKGIGQEFRFAKPYWTSRLKAMGWAAVCSTQFEIGPVSQASLGNVGGGKYEQRKMAYVDLVVTPTVGAGWVILEDALDRHVVRWIESKTTNGVARKVSRMVLNPMRTCANALRFKAPWHRDVR